MTVSSFTQKFRVRFDTTEFVFGFAHEKAGFEQLKWCSSIWFRAKLTEVLKNTKGTFLTFHGWIPSKFTKNKIYYCQSRKYM